MYKEDLALNDLQWLICHKTQPNPMGCFKENLIQPDFTRNIVNKIK